MNELSDILTVDRIDAAMTASNKKGLFQQLAIAAGRKTGVPRKSIAAVLNAREKSGSTGFGGGVAVPHGKLEGLDEVFGYFTRLTAPIAYQSVDEMPVD